MVQMKKTAYKGNNIIAKALPKKASPKKSVVEIRCNKYFRTAAVTCFIFW